MWMGRTVENGRESSSINTRSYGFPPSSSAGSHQSQFHSYNGNSKDRSSDDWRSRIVQNGQWLGEKVVEYGVKLARRGSHNDIPEHRPYNDGRASWMADIRKVDSGTGMPANQPYNGYTYGYQNEFVQGRPSAYSDGTNNIKFGECKMSNISGNPKYSEFSCNSKANIAEIPSPFSSRSPKQSRKKSHDTIDSKRKSRMKKSLRSRKHSSSTSSSSSISSEASNSEESDASASSDTESLPEDLKVKTAKKLAKNRIKKVSQNTARRNSSRKEVVSSFSEDSSSTSSSEGTRRRTSNKVGRKSKTKTKSAIKSSSYNYSYDPSSKIKENSGKLKKVSSKKGKKHKDEDRNVFQKESVVVDLLDVESLSVDPAPAPQNNAVFIPCAPIEQLAGLNFDPVPQNQNNPSFIRAPGNLSTNLSDSLVMNQQDSKLSLDSESVGLRVPGSELFNLDCLVQENKSKTFSSNRTLNELQRQQQPRPPLAGQYSNSLSENLKDGRI